MRSIGLHVEDLSLETFEALPASAATAQAADTNQFKCTYFCTYACTGFCP